MARRLRKIISGGQTGGDFGGLLAGKELGLETGGHAPRGFRTDVGPNPKLKEYGLVEHEKSQYPPRTMKNVDDADLTIAFRFSRSPGTDNTIGYAKTGEWIPSEAKPGLHMGVRGKPVLVITEKNLENAASIIRSTIDRLNPEIVNVAGHREISHPGIEGFVKEALVKGIGSGSEAPKVISTPPTRQEATGSKAGKVQGPLRTRPLTGLKVPESLTPDHVIEALKGTGGDYSSDSIRRSVKQMVESGRVEPKAAGHLALVTVFAGDRLEGVNQAQMMKGGAEGVNERYFEGTPTELAAMRRKRSGTRREMQESVPREYQGLLRGAFGTQEGRRLVLKSLADAMNRGGKPVNKRNLELLADRIAGAREKGRLTLSLKPAEGAPPVGETLTREEERSRNRAESRGMSTADIGPPKRPAPRGARSVPRRLPAPRKEEPKRPTRPGIEEFEVRGKPFRVVRALPRQKGGTGKVAVLGPARTEGQRDYAAKMREEEAGTDPESLAFTRQAGGPGKMGEKPGPLPSMDPGRYVKPERKGPSDKVVRPTLEGVLERKRLREEPPVAEKKKRTTRDVIDRLKKILRSQGAVLNPSEMGPHQAPVMRVRYGPAGKIVEGEMPRPEASRGVVRKLPGPVVPVMGRARKKAR